MKRYNIPRLVHFFGPDGAGKSTHVEILIGIFRKQEPHISKAWLRSPHTLAFLLWRFFVKIGFYRTALTPFGDEIKLPAINRRKSLRIIWAWTEFFSALPRIMRISFFMSRGNKYVAERYILDTVTTIAYFVDDLSFVKGMISRILYHFIPTDTVFIFLDSDYKTVFKRRARTVEPQEFINFQRMAYKALAKSFNAFVINTSEHSIEETSNAIIGYLESR
jgi:thymidylate kinase